MKLPVRALVQNGIRCLILDANNDYVCGTDDEEVTDIILAALNAETKSKEQF